MVKKYLVFLFCLIFPFLAFADALVITVSAKSPEFKITEPTNPTTGYSWNIVYDHDLLSLTTEKTYVPNSKLMGAGGKMIWVFKAKPEAFKKPDSQTMLRLVYERPWNPQDHPKEMYILVKFIPSS